MIATAREKIRLVLSNAIRISKLTSITDNIGFSKENCYLVTPEPESKTLVLAP